MKTVNMYGKKIQRISFGVKRAKKLTRDMYRQKITAFEKIANASSGEKRRKALKHAAWYRFYMRKNFPKSK